MTLEPSAHAWGCTGFDGIVGGQVSEPWPRATIKPGIKNELTIANTLSLPN